jgi:hypothetical protein
MTSVGELKSVVRPVTGKAPSFEGEQFKAKSYVFDAELNEWVSFYWILAHSANRDSCGNQCDWYDNNAEVENEEHFGIKLTDQNLGTSNAKAAALAMYQRQKLAADNGLAPPVHGMCCVKFYRKDSSEIGTAWGYLSSRAVTDFDPVENPNSLYAFEEYLEECKNAWDKYEELESYLESCDWIDGYNQRRMLSDARDCIGYPHPEDVSFTTWCYDNEMPVHDLDGLQEELADLDAAGLQHDFFPLGHKYPENTNMGYDLHDQNVALWQGKIVCIDFGHHCLGKRYKDEHA